MSEGMVKESDGTLGLPLEVLEKLLGFLPIEEAVKASEVCTSWREVIRSSIFWKQYYSRMKKSLWKLVSKHVGGRPDEWAVHFSVAKFDFFGRNLLANPFGEGGLMGWRILSGDSREDNESSGWLIKSETNVPQGIGNGNCFVTDSFSCSKEQRIDLWALGFTPAVMRATVPFTFKWGAYVSTPEGHSGFHEMYIRLLTKTIDELDFAESKMSVKVQSRTIPAGSPFTYYGDSITIREKNVYEIVDKQLRFIYFYHGAMARDNDEGYNGPKIYCPSVSLELFT